MTQPLPATRLIATVLTISIPHLPHPLDTQFA